MTHHEIVSVKYDGKQIYVILRRQQRGLLLSGRLMSEEHVEQGFVTVSTYLYLVCVTGRLMSEEYVEQLRCRTQYVPVLVVSQVD